MNAAIGKVSRRTVALGRRGQRCTWHKVGDRLDTLILPTRGDVSGFQTQRGTVQAKMPPWICTSSRMGLLKTK